MGWEGGWDGREAGSGGRLRGEGGWEGSGWEGRGAGSCVCVLVVLTQVCFLCCQWFVQLCSWPPHITDPFEYFPSPVVTLFQNTRRHSNPVVVEEVALPCLTVLRNLTGLRPPPVLPLKEGEEGSVSEVVGCVLACSCKGRQGRQVVDAVPVPLRGCGGPGDYEFNRPIYYG